MVVLFLTGVVAMIMLRTFISSYNEMQTLEEAQEESHFQFMDNTTEEHLKLMKASLVIDKENSTEVEAQEEDWIDVNDI